MNTMTLKIGNRVRVLRDVILGAAEGDRSGSFVTVPKHSTGTIVHLLRQGQSLPPNEIGVKLDHFMPELEGDTPAQTVRGWNSNEVWWETDEELQWIGDDLELIDAPEVRIDVAKNLTVDFRFDGQNYHLGEQTFASVPQRLYIGGVPFFIVKGWNYDTGTRATIGYQQGTPPRED